jgi:hypothetical protein
MKGSVVRQLIWKEWRLYRSLVLFSIVAGAVGLGIVQLGGESAVVVGTVLFFIAIILAGAMLPLVGIVNERKNRHLAFLMSLPISAMQYTTAKLISTVLMFMVPWLTLIGASLLLVEVRGIVPRGAIPVGLILDTLPLVGLAIITCAGLVGETEGWGIAANVFVQSSYGLVWYFLSRIPALMENAKGQVVIWNSTALSILGSEFGLVVLILAITYFLQSRKRDFI